MRLRNLLVLCFIVFSFSLYAQQNTPSSYTVNKFVVPKPPDISTLMKFTEIPVTNFNGTAQISVPLYNIQSGDLTFPISLNYNSSGIKVSEESGIVGLGWSISTTSAVFELNPASVQSGAVNPPIVPNNFRFTPANTPSNVFNTVASGEAFADTTGVYKVYSSFGPQHTNFVQVSQ
ncbi:hypothetical protein ACVW0P_002556 [Mucilaginibacter sp. UYNi724]